MVTVKSVEKDKYNALQVGAVNHPKIWKVRLSIPWATIPHASSLLQMPSALKGQFSKAEVAPKRKLWEFRVSEDALLPVGTPLSAAHFVPDQYVDVCAKR